MAPRGGLHIGLSGWNYPAWRRRFYQGVPQRLWLRHCAHTFSGVEVNATFYRFIRPEVVAEWKVQAPAGFQFACKGHRFLTHNNRLAGVSELLARQRESLQPLGGQLAVLLWQLPQTLPKDLALLEAFAQQLLAWPGPRHVLEFRHASWHDDQTAELMERLRLSNCRAEGAEWPAWRETVGDLAYMRWYSPPPDLDGLAHDLEEWCEQNRQVHCYLDGDPEGEAPARALALMRLLGQPPGPGEDGGTPPHGGERPRPSPPAA